MNKDLAEALMMLSAICLVLVGTSAFDSGTTKNILMGGLGILAVLMGIIRFFSKKGGEETTEN
ncbi:hypothetical protein [Parabacteroides sp. PF5-9]|uniref:hypothetical protein n=1 Tax=Parabacteroides sp. PF5-9 TaxID=1742404 RepID=UPI002474A37C|nr:hypothetical protein [Parabacteroides sp. PF5-9]